MNHRLITPSSPATVAAVARPRTVSDDDILDAAAAAVAEVGPAEVTLARVGARVGLSAATVLQRFGSRRALLLAVARRGADVLPARLRACTDAPRPAAALVEALVDVAAGVRTSAEFANHLAFLLLDLTDPDFRAVAQEYAAGVESAVADVLRAGQRAGELPGLRPRRAREAARALHCAYNGGLVTWGMTGEGAPGPAVRRQLHHALAPYTAHPTAATSCGAGAAGSASIGSAST